VLCASCANLLLGQIHMLEIFLATWVYARRQFARLPGVQTSAHRYVWLFVLLNQRSGWSNFLSAGLLSTVPTVGKVSASSIE
jgi:hypothetical protein